MVKYWKYRWKYWSSDLQTWHQKCTTQEKQRNKVTSVVLLPWQQFWWELRQYGNHVCSKQNLLCHFKGLKMRVFGFWQKETRAKRIFLAATLWKFFWFRLWCTFLCQVLSPGQTDRQVVASRRKLNLGTRDLRWVAKRTRKFPRKYTQVPKKHFKADYPLFHWLILG